MQWTASDSRQAAGHGSESTDHGPPGPFLSDGAQCPPPPPRPPPHTNGRGWGSGSVGGTPAAGQGGGGILQGIALHLRFWGLGQLSPPGMGSCVTMNTRVCLPPPHVWLHAVHSDHLPSQSAPAAQPRTDVKALWAGRRCGGRKAGGFGLN